MDIKPPPPADGFVQIVGIHEDATGRRAVAFPQDMPLKEVLQALNDAAEDIRIRLALAVFAKSDERRIHIAQAGDLLARRA